MLARTNNTAAVSSSCHATACGRVGYIQLVTYLFRWRPIGVFGKLCCILQTRRIFLRCLHTDALFERCQFRQIALRGSVHLTTLRASPLHSICTKRASASESSSTPGPAVDSGWIVCSRYPRHSALPSTLLLSLAWTTPLKAQGHSRPSVYARLASSFCTRL